MKNELNYIPVLYKAVEQPQKRQVLSHVATDSFVKPFA